MTLLERNTKSKQIKELIEDRVQGFLDDCKIESEGYPHQPYIGSCPDMIEYFSELVDDVNKILENKNTISSILEYLTPEQISKMISLSNYNDFEELNELDVINDYESEIKYNYCTIIYEYLKSDKYYAIQIQRTHDDSVDLNLKWLGEIQIVTYTWDI